MNQGPGLDPALFFSEMHNEMPLKLRPDYPDYFLDRVAIAYRLLMGVNRCD
jgi:hypothetical protein